MAFLALREELRLILLALTVSAVAGLPRTDRIDGLRAVERARYAFTLNATRPFDEVYPRSVFEKKALRQEAEERVLKNVFGLGVTQELLSQEFDRIERETRAPEQWESIKTALGGDRRRIEEIFCRPLLVERALRARFDFDQRIHAVPHQKAREARAAFLAGKTPSGVKALRISRKPETPATTDELLEKSRAEASGPRLLDAGERPSVDSPVSADPEMARVLEKELKQPEDVTTILEERDRFSVFRLQNLTASQWSVLAFQVSKRDFESWFQEVRRRRAREMHQVSPGAAR